MSAVYIELTFEVSPLQPGTEILIAELGALGFESFVESEEGSTKRPLEVGWQAVPCFFSAVLFYAS